MKKNNIIIVTLAIVLIASTGYWYNEARLNLNDRMDLTGQLIDAKVDIDRLIQSEKTAIDSANHYKLLSEETNHKVDSLEDKTEEYKKEIDNIPNLIASMTPNETYDSLQNFIPTPTGELEYGFDSTQVKSLYADELELTKLKPMVITLGQTVNTQKIKIGYIENETMQLRIAVDSCNVRADVALDMANTAIDQVEAVEKELKWWKRGSVATVVLIVIAALL